MNNNKDEIVLFENGELALEVNVSPQLETVWLSSNQMALLYGRDEKTIRKHVNKIFTDGELERESNTQKMRVAGVSQPVAFYNLDVIISVGYRVNSKQGIAFRKWANSILKQYIIQGYAVNANRMNQLGEVIRIMKRTENSLDAKPVLSVIEKYSLALDLLDDYDHQTMKRPDGNKAVYILSYEECRQVIDSMKFSTDSDLFGNEKDDSNLLYFITKNHSFSDGNKRIAATMFLYFLDKNGILFADGNKLIDDHTLVALTIMIAESKPDEKEMMISVIMNCICG